MARSRYKRKGKSKFLMIEGYIMRSPAWRALSPHDKAAYLELKWRYDGLNNGRIGLGCRELAEALQSSKDTARRSLDSLVEKGFLAKAKLSGFNVKNRAATEWRLTEYGCDKTGELATKDFMRWQPEEKTQAHQKDVQAHHRDTLPPKSGRNQPHRRTTGTVKPKSPVSQAHEKDTYSITMEGAADAA
jgi:hypothetical protein